MPTGWSLYFHQHKFWWLYNKEKNGRAEAGAVIAWRACLIRCTHPPTFLVWDDPVWWDILKLQESHNFPVGSRGIMWCWVWSCCVLRWIGAPPPPTLWWVERAGETERGEQLTYPQYLTTCSLELLQMGFSFRTAHSWSVFRNGTSVSTVYASRASSERALSSRPSKGSVGETWDRRDAVQLVHILVGISYRGLKMARSRASPWSDTLHSAALC